MNILLKNPMRQGNEKTERIKKTAGLILLFISVWILTKAAISRNTYTPYVPKEPAAILLYGEVPGVEAFYEKEYEISQRSLQDRSRAFQFPYHGTRESSSDL